AGDVRRAAGIHLGRAPVPGLLPGLRGRRGRVPAAVDLVDGGAGRADRADPGRVRRGVRTAAGLRHVVPEPAGDAADPADPDEGADAGDRVRPVRADAGLHRPAAGRGPLRPPGRDAVRLAADPLLAWAKQGFRAALAASLQAPAGMQAGGPEQSPFGPRGPRRPNMRIVP